MFNDFDGDWGFDAYDYYYEEMLDRKDIRDEQEEQLRKVSDGILFLKYEAEARNSKWINEIIPNNNFPAFDIAFKLKKSGRKPTAKQRKALENVLAYYYSVK